MTERQNTRTTLRALNEEQGAESARLSSAEIRWRDRQPFLAARGYLLRPRYHVGWIPSWKDKPDIEPELCEDSLELPVSQWITSTLPLVNAVQLRREQADAATMNGEPVYLKCVPTDGTELQIAQMFSREDLKHDPRNHCVPILDAFPDQENSAITYLVMPLLRTHR